MSDSTVDPRMSVVILTIKEAEACPVFLIGTCGAMAFLFLRRFPDLDPDDVAELRRVGTGLIADAAAWVRQIPSMTQPENANLILLPPSVPMLVAMEPRPGQYIRMGTAKGTMRGLGSKETRASRMAGFREHLARTWPTWAL